MVLIPGLLAGDSSLSVLRGWLNRLGYEARGSGIVSNVDCADRAVDSLERRVEARPFSEAVPLTSIYSKGDGVVRWRACLVDYARCIEVSGSRVGLAFNRKVYRELGDTLARETAGR